MAEIGGCSSCNATVPMSAADQSRWVRSLNGIQLKPTNKNDSRTCMSWSTEGTCEFKQKDITALQASLEASGGCNGVWAAPLWMVGGTWVLPQSATGEIDFFERGCDTSQGYVLAYGDNPSVGWGETPTQDSRFTAYMTFDKNNDVVKNYKCPFGANPIADGNTSSCQLIQTKTGYFNDTKSETNNGEEYMRLVSDVWNKCSALNCGQARTSDNKCAFNVSNISMTFTPESTTTGSPFKNQNSLCNSIWHAFNCGASDMELTDNHCSSGYNPIPLTIKNACNNRDWDCGATSLTDDAKNNPNKIGALRCYEYNKDFFKCDTQCK